METKNRNIYIDILKGVLITLVVIGHLQFFEYDSRTLTLIYSFHMPAFLIIAGILSHINENSSYIEIIKKRFKNILIPYFIFYFISMIIVPANSFEQRTQSIIVMFNGIGNPNYAINLPLWFLPFYFCTITIFELLECSSYKLSDFLINKFSQTDVSKKNILSETSSKKKTSKKSSISSTDNSIIDKSNKFSKFIKYKFEFIESFTFIAIALLMAFAFYYARIYKGRRLPLNFEISLFCLGFVFIGKIFAHYVPDIFSKVKSNKKMKTPSIIFSILSVAIIMAFWYYFSMKNGRIDLNARDYKNALYMYIDAILGFILLAVFSYPITLIPIIKNIVAYLGKNSIYILAYHIPSVIVTHNIIIPLLPTTFAISLNTNSITSILFFTLAGIIFSLFMKLIHKTCNFPAQLFN